MFISCRLWQTLRLLCSNKGPPPWRGWWYSCCSRSDYSFLMRATGLWRLCGGCLALAPREIVRGVSSFFVSLSALYAENRTLQTQRLKFALAAQQTGHLAAE